MEAHVRVEHRDLSSPDAQRLIAILNAELNGRYPEPGANHFRLDPNEVTPGRGAFLVAYRGDEAVGCGALRLVGGGDAEIKRMLVIEASRGLGRRMLEALEAEARTLGATRLVLETGVRQPEAIALYESAGFEHIDAFGEYVDSAFSLCMAKTLVT